jgi:hypothetical protein
MSLARRVAFTLETTPPARAIRGSPVSRTASRTRAIVVCSTTRCAEIGELLVRKSPVQSRQRRRRIACPGVFVSMTPSRTCTHSISGLSASAIGAA